MDKIEILLIVNSILLGCISALFLVIGYFIKDLHRDFKSLIERVNNLYTDLHTHISLFDNLTKIFQKQIDGLSERLIQVEKRKEA